MNESETTTSANEGPSHGRNASPEFSDDATFSTSNTTTTGVTDAIGVGSKPDHLDEQTDNMDGDQLDEGPGGPPSSRPTSSASDVAGDFGEPIEDEELVALLAQLEESAGSLRGTLSEAFSIVEQEEKRVQRAIRQETKLLDKKQSHREHMKKQATLLNASDDIIQEAIRRKNGEAQRPRQRTDHINHAYLAQTRAKSRSPAATTSKTRVADQFKIDPERAEEILREYEASKEYVRQVRQTALEDKLKQQELRRKQLEAAAEERRKRELEAMMRDVEAAKEYEKSKRSQLVHDSDYMKRVPKSKFYRQIVEGEANKAAPSPSRRSPARKQKSGQDSSQAQDRQKEVRVVEEHASGEDSDDGETIPSWAIGAPSAASGTKPADATPSSSIDDTSPEALQQLGLFQNSKRLAAESRAEQLAKQFGSQAAQSALIDTSTDSIEKAAAARAIARQRAAKLAKSETEKVDSTNVDGNHSSPTSERNKDVLLQVDAAIQKKLDQRMQERSKSKQVHHGQTGKNVASTAGAGVDVGVANQVAGPVEAEAGDGSVSSFRPSSLHSRQEPRGAGGSRSASAKRRGAPGDGLALSEEQMEQASLRSVPLSASGDKRTWIAPTT